MRLRGAVSSIRSRIRWERRLEPAHAITAGWDACLDGDPNKYLGAVWLDGSFSRGAVVHHRGSIALAAEALVIQLERELG